MPFFIMAKKTEFSVAPQPFDEIYEGLEEKRAINIFSALLLGPNHVDLQLMYTRISTFICVLCRLTICK